MAPEMLQKGPKNGPEKNHPKSPKSSYLEFHPRKT